MKKNFTPAILFGIVAALIFTPCQIFAGEHIINSSEKTYSRSKACYSVTRSRRVHQQGIRENNEIGEIII